MNAAMFLVQQEARKFEQHCVGAAQRVRLAMTMWEVRRAAEVVAPSILRGVHLDRRVKLKLQQAAEQRMSELLTEQLAAAAVIADLEERRAFVGNLRHKHWDALRGDYSELYHKAEMEGQRLLAKP